MRADFWPDTLKVALNDASLVERAFAYVGHPAAARQVAGEIKKQLKDPLSELASAQKKGTEPFNAALSKWRAEYREERFEQIISETAKAYICQPLKAGNLLACKNFSDSPFGDARLGRLWMITYLLSKLTFSERQVVLLLRFPDTSIQSVSEDLSLPDYRVAELSENANDAIAACSNEMTWKDSKPKNDFSFAGDVPAWDTFKKIYDEHWSAAVQELAYNIIVDEDLSARRIVDRVLRVSRKYLESEKFDFNTAWDGNTEKCWPGFRSLTFMTCKVHILNLSADNTAKKTRIRQGDVWARGIHSLNVLERQCLLFSIFFPESISELVKSVNTLDDPAVEAHVATAIGKIIKHSLSYYRG